MTKKEIEEVADAIVAITDQYTRLYCEREKTQRVDRQLSSALHIGFLAGMRYSGVDEDDVMQAIQLAQIKISLLDK